MPATRQILECLVSLAAGAAEPGAVLPGEPGAVDEANEPWSCEDHEPLPSEDNARLPSEDNELLAAASSSDPEALPELLRRLAETGLTQGTGPEHETDTAEETGEEPDTSPSHGIDLAAESGLVQGIDPAQESDSASEPGPVPPAVVSFLEAHCWLAARLVVRSGACVGAEPRTDCARRLLASDCAALSVDRAQLWARLAAHAHRGDFEALLRTVRAQPGARLRADPALRRLADAALAHLALAASSPGKTRPLDYFFYIFLFKI